MARTETCNTCLGTGTVYVPTIQEKLVNHVIYTRGQPSVLYLNPPEVAELLDALGVTVPAEPPDGG